MHRYVSVIQYLDPVIEKPSGVVPTTPFLLSIDQGITTAQLRRERLKRKVQKGIRDAKKAIEIFLNPHFRSIDTWINARIYSINNIPCIQPV